MHLFDMVSLQNTTSNVFYVFQGLSTNVCNFFHEKITSEELVPFRLFSKKKLLTRFNALYIISILGAINRDVHKSSLKDVLSNRAIRDPAGFFYKSCL